MKGHRGPSGETVRENVLFSFICCCWKCDIFIKMNLKLCVSLGWAWHHWSARREGRRLADLTQSNTLWMYSKLWRHGVLCCAVLFQGDPGLRGDAGRRGEQGPRGKPGGRGTMVGINRCMQTDVHIKKADLSQLFLAQNWYLITDRSYWICV